MIGDNTIVKMPAVGVDTAKIHLAAGVEESIGWLVFDEKIMRAGTWGSSASGARNKDDTHFSGSGILRVLHDTGGTLILIK